MIPADNTPDNAKDEDQLASILKSTENNVPPPDAETLAKLRTESAAAFASAHPAATPKPPSSPQFFSRSERWIGVIAALVLIALGSYFWLGSNDQALALGKALENSETSGSIHGRFNVPGFKFEGEVWGLSRTKQSRWDQADGSYRVSDGQKAWYVNEKANEARRAMPSENAGRPIREFLDFINLIRPIDRNTLLAIKPNSLIHDGGQEFLVYLSELPSHKPEPGLRFWFEARVNTATKRLHSIRTWTENAGKKEPIADLTVLAYDEPIAADKFVIADTLTEDGRIGKVTDVQGIVAVKPVLYDRWTPVREHLVLKPGDLLRTDARGANAAALKLVKNTGVILGPKTLVELVSPKQIRLVEGEIEITAAAGTSIELLGPSKQKLTVKGKQFFRVEKQELAQVKKEPAWLAGFKGVATNESLGSLVALVDGRNVPLTVGYHKVQVDIRDQIARTVIEESFVNHTKWELEGVFYFPLPADASISGFGMWIGDKLVEADVVEKQRAREIYEQILRERKDPGLLEWSGGNIFKARVFPIPARGEKRIKISYTQVLPMKGNRYRYSYALQSELLQQNPLRELSIDLKLNSVTPLKSVSSPTHPTKDDLTTHSAHIEFSAQEYAPTRDFEVVVETAGRQSDVVMIPHRRGDDGYFMLQLTPPGAGGDWDRPLLPNGDPLNLLILADTSASIDANQRTTQSAFIGALLSSLTPKDTFNLATCDVATDWVFATSQSANEKHVAAARDFLAKRTSLGWTDLDAAFTKVLKQAKPGAHVIYIGDGIPTARDTDPTAFSNRLRRLLGQAFQPDLRPAFHAVTLSSSFESGVLKTIASIGGGSMRKITAEQGPAVIARELLGEIATPALRNIKVEFKGIKVARLYPESVANLPAGSQQILLGRYLPSGKDQEGEIVVTGTQGSKSVKFSTRVSLKDADQGNSFIPRLWARMHLDALLEQGSSEAIKDQIINLSEEFNIITPYTSFLVLETDADRERFKVKRRFQMRDGEQFFAEGRDNAVFDLAQKQMKRAANWRTALRRSILRNLATAGRDPRMFQPSPYRRQSEVLGGMISDDTNSLPYDFASFNLGEPAGVGGWKYDPAWDPLGDLSSSATELDVFGRPENMDEYLGKDMASKEEFQELAMRQLVDGQSNQLGLEDGLRREPEILSLADPFPLFRQLEGKFSKDSLEDGEGVSDFKSSRGLYAYDGRLGRSIRRPYYGHWLNTLFPQLPGTPGEPSEPKNSWPASAKGLAKGLLRIDKLAKLTGAIEIVRKHDTFDTRWGDLSSRSERRELFTAKSWLTRSSSDGGQTIVTWADLKEVGIYSRAFQLGRIRASSPRDVQPPPLQLNDHSLSSLEHTYSTTTATVERQGKSQALLVLKYTDSPEYVTHIVIDTDRNVILSIESRYKDKVTNRTKFDDFVEASGSWWARKIETFDGDSKRISLTTQTVKTLSQAEYDQQAKAELADRALTHFLHLPMPTLAAAKKAHAVSKAAFDEHFVLTLHFYRSQQWKRVLDHWQQAEKLAAGKPGLRWVRSALLYDSRRHDELRQRYHAEVAAFAKGKWLNGYYLTDYVVGQSGNVLQANEMLSLLDTVKPLYLKQPAHVRGNYRWLTMRVSYLEQTGRSDEALALQMQVATDFPRDYHAQQRYAQMLSGIGDFSAAHAWLKRVMVKKSKWLEWEEESLRNVSTSLLQQEGRYDDLIAYLAEWMKQNPRSRSAYEQYLSALIKSDQIDKAATMALAWLKDGQVKGELPAETEGRLNAAVQLMLGRGHQLWSNRIEESWLAPLGDAALFFARHETQHSLTQQIITHHSYQGSDEGRKVRKKLAGLLGAEIDKLPAEQVRRLIGWLNRDDADPAAWKEIIAKLRQRWTAEADDTVKHRLGDALLVAYSRHDSPGEPLAFLRLQWKTGSDKRRADYANQLFDHLLSAPWTTEIESEAIAMLDKLSASEDSGARLFASVAALHRLNDRMIDNRIAAENAKIEHPEKLTRTELAKKQDAIRRATREALSDRLRTEAGKHPKTLAPWIMAESLYLDVLLDRNLKSAAAKAWEVIDVPLPKEKKELEFNLERQLDQALRHRHVVTLMNLAARKGAEPALISRLLKHLDQEIAASPDVNHWKAVKYQLLVALDQTKELEKTLTVWTRVDDPDNRWRIALGNLLAEQGQVKDAIREFEAVEAADELTPADYRVLSDWYLIDNQREKSERSALAIYQTMPEYRLSQMIAAKLQPWQRGDRHLPTELDKEVLRMFNVLFAKSVSPRNYLHQLQAFYQASHDFRLLQGLPDALIGHTAGRVYPFVEGMRSILDEVRDEATADEIVKRIAEVRPRAKTEVDKRALDLLEVLVERRAAELMNQPGPHRNRALAALVRAGKGEWSPGEPRLMADFLAWLGKITQEKLAQEQMRQFKDLQTKASAGSLDRLHIAERYAVTLNNYDQRQNGIDVLQAALDEFQTANDGALPVTGHDALNSYVNLLEWARHFVRAEKVLLGHLKRPVHAQQRRWLSQRLDRTYLYALRDGGEVTFGKGRDLYQGIAAKLQKDLADPDPNHRYHLVEMLSYVYREARRQKLAGVAEDVRAFAFKVLPPILKEQRNHHDSMVSLTASALHDLAGPRDGIVFLLDRIETEPRWLRLSNQDGWSRHGHSLAVWRTEAKDLGDVEARLLKVTLAELRRDLESRESRNRSIYVRPSGYFWTEKAGDFVKTTESVLAERSKSNASVKYIADYLYHGLILPKRAIEILFIAHRLKLLDEDGQATLIHYLHEQDRHGESIAVLEPLVERRPTNLDYRILLMRAYFKSDRQAELLTLLKATDTFFHEKGRWNERAMARLAESTLKNQLYTQSVAYYKELIPLHERTHPGRGVGNGTLSGYYRGLARAQAGLKKTSEAVDAAAAAIVAWGGNIEGRTKALGTLVEVLQGEADLDNYTKQLNERNQDSAIIRKAIGQVYRDKKQFARAIQHLTMAVTLQPNDMEIHKMLIECHDGLDDKQGAIRQLLSAIQASRREIKLYEDLGRRYSELKDSGQTERAYTSMVEMLPTESESHQLLAEIREKQNRWPEAIRHWEEVVKLRSLEPTGLLGLGAAQVHEKQWEQARATLKKLESRTWPSHFRDASEKIAKLRQAIAAGGK